MRSILDLHDNISCSIAEPKIITLFFDFINKFKDNPNTISDIENAHISLNVLDEAISLFVKHINMTKTNPNEMQCSTDSSVLLYSGLKFFKTNIKHQRNFIK